MWQASVLTLYPDMFPGPLGHSILGRALETGLWGLETIDIRRFAKDKHQTVDDTPAGGGAGMVMRADVIAAAVDHHVNDDVARPRWFLSPRGRPLTQEKIRKIAGGPGVVLLCGRFEGVDQRVIDGRGFEEVSLGDFVLNGGEVAAMAVIEGAVRLLPGVIGADTSLNEESFVDGLLEYPHYTRPRDWEGRLIPDVLLSGDHGEIAKWRRAQAEDLTREVRPDLWQRRQGR